MALDSLWQSRLACERMRALRRVEGILMSQSGVWVGSDNRPVTTDSGWLLLAFPYLCWERTWLP